MSGVPLRRKLAAILSADVVGYSAMMAQDEESTLSRLAQCREIIDGLIISYHGRIVGTAGDSILAEFASAVDAVRAATEIQDSIKTRNTGQPPSRQMLFRIGINVGDVVDKDGDLLGDGVNVAARLQGLAEPGGINIAGSVYDQIQGKLNLTFGYDGERQLKNIPRPVHVFRLERQDEPEAQPPADAHDESRRDSADDGRAPAAPATDRAPEAIPVAGGRAPGGIAGVVAAFRSASARSKLAAAGIALAAVLGIGTLAALNAVPSPETAPQVLAEKEEALWRHMGASDRPEDLKAFLDAFPAGLHTAEARARLDALEARRQAEQAKAIEVGKRPPTTVPTPRERKPKTTPAQDAAGAEPAPAAVDPPAPVADTRLKFDGAWQMVSECQALPGDQGFTDRRALQIENGKFASSLSSPQGKSTLEGSISPDGALSARGHAQGGGGGLVPLQLKARPDGERRFSGEFWWDRRLCYATLTKG